MTISDNIIKECLRHVYFINGTAYAGKSTMVRLLADKHGMIFCGENYHSSLAEGIATPEHQPGHSYSRTMKDWQEFIHRTPEEYRRWTDNCTAEATEFELVQLLRLSAGGQRIIVDTNIPPELLHKISDYHRVAIMLSPQEMSVEYFFARADADKQFIWQQIQAAPDPEKTLALYRACIAAANTPEIFVKMQNSGFFTLYRDNAETDTREEVLHTLEKHFGLADF